MLYKIHSVDSRCYRIIGEMNSVRNSRFEAHVAPSRRHVFHARRVCLHARASARLHNDTLNSKGKRYPDANGAH